MRITIVDAATGHHLVAQYVPLDSLPESFLLDTVLHLGNEALHVVSAHPPTRDWIANEGSVTVTVKRPTVTREDASHEGLPLRLRLPTIHHHLPEWAASGRPCGAALRLHSDDWRQVEFVAEDLIKIVLAEFTAIQRVFAVKKGSGFTTLHQRLQPEQPLSPTRLTVDAVTQALADTRLDGLWVDDIAGEAGAVAGGSAFCNAGGLRGYWVAQGGLITTLGLADRRGPFAFSGDVPERLDLGSDQLRIAAFASDHRLLLIDWCTTTIVCGGSRVVG